MGKQGVKKPLRIVGRPSHGDARLEVVFVPVVHRLSAVGWTGGRNAHRGDEVVALGGRGQTALEISTQGGRLASAASLQQPGLNFEAISLVHGTLQAITKSQGEREVGTNLPGILYVFLVGLGGKVPCCWRPCRGQTAILVEGEVGGVLREPPDDGRGRVLHFRDGVQRLSGSGTARQIVRSQVILEISRNTVPGPSKIKRSIRDPVIKRIREADATVVNLANIGSKLEGMFSVDPRNIIRDVVDRRNTAKRV